MSEPELVTTPVAARRLGISARTLQRYVKDGLLEPDLTLPGGTYRWDMDNLRRQLKALRQTERD
jgi:DNA-binding transcriptional MerR regulator